MDGILRRQEVINGKINVKLLASPTIAVLIDFLKNHSYIM